MPYKKKGNIRRTPQYYERIENKKIEEENKKAHRDIIFGDYPDELV